MRLFVLCFAQIILYTLGVILACGLAVEVCYRLFYLLLGRRAGRFFWLITSWLGTPLHELGHALMCILFAHRIECIRLFPSKRGGAMVEHSYNRKNPYATFGNLWIGLGPVFSGLAFILVVLWFVCPVSMQDFGALVRALLAGERAMGDLLWEIDRVIRGLFLEQTRPLWLRLLSAFAMLSVSFHVRVSASDIKGMLKGVPGYLALSVAIALVAVCMGEEYVYALAAILESVACVLALLFGLILLFACFSLALVLLYRVVLGVIRPLCQRYAREA
jgi:hypothetical protein